MDETACTSKLLSSNGLSDQEEVQLLVGRGTRGLGTCKTVEAGHAVWSLPWNQAITPTTALRRLRRDEARGRGLLPRGVEALLDAIESGDLGLVKASFSWILLLVLQLLSELRDPKSAWLAYLQTLPAPPGSLVKSVCQAGCDATDLLLFSDAELEELQCVPLAEAVRMERKRISELHCHLFAKPGTEPAVGLHSFMWAHCLVRSRALDLTGYPEAKTPGNAGGFVPFRCRCMLPVLDLCNHAAQANCHLSVSLQPNGQPRSVDLIVSQDLAAGSELLLNYGDRSLSDFLQGYGFVPHNGAHTSPREVYAEFGSAWQVLSVSGNAEGKMFRLSSIHSMPEMEGTPLELDKGPASMLFVVKDEQSNLPEEVCSAPRVYHSQGNAGSAEQAASASKGRYLDAEQERELALMVAEECVVIQTRMLTSLEQDEHLSGLLNMSEQARLDSATLESQQGEPGKNAYQEARNRSWYQNEHANMALHFRMERKKLLRRLIDDLQGQACLFGCAAG